MKKYIVLFLIVSIALASCEKEIDIDYRNVNRLYVAEAILKNEKNPYGYVYTKDTAMVYLSRTQDVTDNTGANTAVKGATILITNRKYMLTDTLKYKGDNLYAASVMAIPGMTYDLDIYIDDQHFTSSSVMQEMPEVDSIRFVWKKVFSEKILFADLRIKDRPNENNYYFMHLFRSGIGYRWAVMKDDKNPGGQLQQLFQCSTERDMDAGKSDALRDGEPLIMEVRSIDRQSYDYLYSMQVMDNAGTNPIANFTGGCLGYFSAFSSVKKFVNFQRKNIVEE